VLYTCVLIDQKKDVNKMDAYNLATVLGTWHSLWNHISITLFSIIWTV
jgi:hypothetical protein